MSESKMLALLLIVRDFVDEQENNMTAKRCLYKVIIEMCDEYADRTSGDLLQEARTLILAGKIS
jgi:hypothetical protein